MPYFKPFPVAGESALKRFGGRAQTVVRRCTRTHSPATAGANRAPLAQAASWRMPMSVSGPRADVTDAALPLNAAPQVRIVGKARISCAAAARLGSVIASHADQEGAYR